VSSSPSRLLLHHLRHMAASGPVPERIAAEPAVRSRARGTRVRISGMVQMDKVAEIRKAWEAAGSPPCEHPDVEREYYLGSNTGDRVCVRCGETVSTS
jgi:hypothetical protein